jgi:DUF1016 N-terminal domain
MSKLQMPVPAGFPNLLREIKARIQQAQTRAILAANSELVRLYWDIGRLIDQRQRQEGWGAAVIPRLARELRNELPDVKGFSERTGAAMTQPAKTVQPIHFEDFDGFQFERLALAYHARIDKWRSLEWYGQGGSALGRDIWGIREDATKDGESVCIFSGSTVSARPTGPYPHV